MQQAGVVWQAVRQVASIALKANEPGILAFCSDRHLPFVTFSAQQLNGLKGEFSSSGFVKSVTGVDNVCERSAVLASGGRLICKKCAFGPVTVALAIEEYTVRFEETV